ncbi:hypothetical protein GUJ93_ZPchr0006g45038 [Zizania palustris]|uniref:Uncharacterized protein n=1 Tax=Zizania palustris TaxID=103762 RepID=A0A8J5VGN2_ZIZPA|nr:hypothetical protein GUJ93_ZPchr0006g45038 [Zizania palustris]
MSPILLDVTTSTSLDITAKANPLSFCSKPSHRFDIKSSIGYLNHLPRHPPHLIFATSRRHVIIFPKLLRPAARLRRRPCCPRAPQPPPPPGLRPAATAPARRRPRQRRARTPPPPPHPRPRASAPAATARAGAAGAEARGRGCGGGCGARARRWGRRAGVAAGVAARGGGGARARRRRRRAAGRRSLGKMMTWRREVAKM